MSSETADLESIPNERMLPINRSQTTRDHLPTDLDAECMSNSVTSASSYSTNTDDALEDSLRLSGVLSRSSSQTTLSSRSSSPTSRHKESTDESDIALDEPYKRASQRSLTEGKGDSPPAPGLENQNNDSCMCEESLVLGYRLDELMRFPASIKCSDCEWESLSAALDTGSDYSIITLAIAKKLRMKIIDIPGPSRQTVASPFGTIELGAFVVASIKIFKLGIGEFNAKLMVLSEDNPRSDIIIGRHIIGKFGLMNRADEYVRGFKGTIGMVLRVEKDAAVEGLGEGCPNRFQIGRSTQTNDLIGQDNSNITPSNANQELHMAQYSPTLPSALWNRQFPSNVKSYPCRDPSSSLNSAIIDKTTTCSRTEYVAKDINVGNAEIMNEVFRDDLVDRILELVLDQGYGISTDQLQLPVQAWTVTRQFLEGIDLCVEEDFSFKDLQKLQNTPNMLQSNGPDEFLSLPLDSDEYGTWPDREQNPRAPGKGRGKDDKERDEGEGDNKNNPIEGVPRKKAKVSVSGPLACPYRKRNPRRFNIRDKPNCAIQHFQDISILKNHIKAYHKYEETSNKPHKCRRCHERFATDDELDAHCRMPQPCALRDKDDDPRDDAEDGITEEIEAQLKIRTSGSKIMSWKHLWMVLFPSDIERLIPSSEFKAPLILEAEELVFICEKFFSQDRTPCNTVIFPKDQPQEELRKWVANLTEYSLKTFLRDYVNGPQTYIPFQQPVPASNVTNINDCVQSSEAGMQSIQPPTTHVWPSEIQTQFIPDASTDTVLIGLSPHNSSAAHETALSRIQGNTVDPAILNQSFMTNSGNHSINQLFRYDTEFSDYHQVNKINGTEEASQGMEVDGFSGTDLISLCDIVEEGGVHDD